MIMKSLTMMKTAVAAVCMSLIFGSCVIHRHYDGPRPPKKHKKHKKPKPPRHHRHHAYTDGNAAGGTYYADAWYSA